MVAVKFLLAQQPAHVDATALEAMVSLAVRHPNVVRRRTGVGGAVDTAGMAVGTAVGMTVERLRPRTVACPQPTRHRMHHMRHRPPHDRHAPTKCCRLSALLNLSWPPLPLLLLRCTPTVRK